MVMVYDRPDKISPNSYKYNCSMEVEEIVRDYTAYRLRQAGFNNWREEPTEHPSPPLRTIRLLGQQFELAYNNAFDDMTQNIDVSGPQAQEAFTGICTVLFENGIQWGRIVGLLVFAVKLSLKAMENDMPNRVDHIVQWTTNHLQSDRFARWITENGGWVSINYTY